MKPVIDWSAEDWHDKVIAELRDPAVSQARKNAIAKEVQRVCRLVQEDIKRIEGLN